MGHEVGFLPSDKHESFLQVDSITLSVGSQACAKYPKQNKLQVVNYYHRVLHLGCCSSPRSASDIFAISKGTR